MAALRHDRIYAPFLLDGPVNRDGFLTYVRDVLALTLSPGDIVVADNLACHKHPDVRRADGSAFRAPARLTIDLPNQVWCAILAAFGSAQTRQHGR